MSYYSSYNPMEGRSCHIRTWLMRISSPAGKRDGDGGVVGNPTLTLMLLLLGPKLLRQEGKQLAGGRIACPLSGSPVGHKLKDR